MKAGKLFLILMATGYAFLLLLAFTSCEKNDMHNITFIHGEPDTLSVICNGTVFFIPPAPPGGCITYKTHDGGGNMPMVGEEYIARRLHNDIEGEESVPAVVVAAPNANVIFFRKQ